MNKKILSLLGILPISMAILVGCNNGKDKGDVYDERGYLKLELRNLYFSDWAGGDPYLEELENKFKVAITPKSYSYNDWGTQVTSAVNANNLPDVFHYDLESFNFGNTYEAWAKGAVTKALPNDLSRWPNLKTLIDNVSNVESLKINGKLYGIPLSYNFKDPNKDFSSFTYVYHRDWVKKIDKAHEGETGYVPLYKANDVYTWDEFLRVLYAFKNEIEIIKSGNGSALGDVEWGFPSITNFYKDAPHCYTYDSTGKVVNAFTTDKYCTGLKKAKELAKDNTYFDQATAKTGDVHTQYKAGKIGVYYENLSLSNYTTLRKEYLEVHPTLTSEELDDALAFMKVKGPDGKYSLEGTDNWFSITLFNYDISENKMNKILDLIDYLLSEEGTRLAIYGIEGYDYEVNSQGEIELLELGWLKDKNGDYVPKMNGAKYLRYMATLGYDTQGFDPMINAHCFEIVNQWSEEMKQAKNNGELRIFMEPGEIKWMSGDLKNRHTSDMLDEGNANAMKFCYGESGYQTIDDYKSKFSETKWGPTLTEINNKLGK